MSIESPWLYLPLAVSELTLVIIGAEASITISLFAERLVAGVKFVN
jgi:hypothetical protein